MIDQHEKTDLLITRLKESLPIVDGGQNPRLFGAVADPRPSAVGAAAPTADGRGSATNFSAFN